ncbi:Glutathione S-transferase GST-6.0 [Cercospora beticola]|uniref:Glutathione S-transferase GST-6.0 n=2 Tax=Cercospora beticola TaxID=122368 RepID=A0A2G5HUY3_CERBT|nr:Glutathione S-transferase GST-6.0 [Cercospora beticola]PIA96350.1 Glutathione S-transferase GST-6.0 [Cercospora beticola]
MLRENHLKDTMSLTIKLYYWPGACSMASQILLADSGLAYEAIKINLQDPPARAEYMRTLNPKGQIPTLVIDGEIITEGPAVITAISQLVPEKCYTGSTPMENVRFYEWMNFLSGTVLTKSFGGLFKPSWYSDDPSAAEGIIAKSKVNISAGFQLIEDRLEKLSDPTHALGHSLTGVDAYLAVFITWANRFQIDISKYPNYRKLFDSISRTAAFKAAQEKQV